MADIELVIKIPEEAYKASHNIHTSQMKFIQMPLKIIANGIPLPKGHGDLIDRDDWSGNEVKIIDLQSVLDADAIVEAIKETK